MRNFVAKNDFNRATTHRDRKNDYTREWNLSEELEDNENDTNGDLNKSISDAREEDS